MKKLICIFRETISINQIFLDNIVHGQLYLLHKLRIHVARYILFGFQRRKYSAIIQYCGMQSPIVQSTFRFPLKLSSFLGKVFYLQNFKFGLYFKTTMLQHKNSWQKSLYLPPNYFISFKCLRFFRFLQVCHVCHKNKKETVISNL